jgi:O-antigen/teichoic acid export membrane protein
MSTISIDKLTSKKLLFSNSIISLLTNSTPLIIAFFTIPLIIKGLGTERFGLLTLIWSIIGASSILDFGLGHALTQFVSKKLGNNETKNIEIYIWTSIFVIFILGIIASSLVCVLTPIITSLLKTPNAYIEETQLSFYLLAFSLPFLMLNICLAGVCEACQKFSAIGILRIPVIFCNYIGPLLVLPFTKSLWVVVIVLCLGRFITSIAYFIFSYKIISGFSKQIKINFAYIKPLLKFGSWITISNIINTIMVNLDRFLIAGLISAAVLAFYTTPLEVLARISIIPAAIMSVMFPAFSAEFTKNKKRARELFFDSIKIVFLLIFPIVSIIIIFAKAGLSIWINPEFSSHSYKITQLMAIGALILGLNACNYNFIQATGRSDIPAKLQMCEMPLYIALLFIMIKVFGIKGAAISWLLRIIFDFTVLSFVSYKLMKD